MLTLLPSSPQHLDGARLPLIAIAVTLALALISPDTAFATASDITSGTPTGFDKVAKDVYELATGGLGKTIATVAIVSGFIGLWSGFNTRASLGAAGTGFAVAAGPPLVAGFAGTGIF